MRMPGDLAGSTVMRCLNGGTDHKPANLFGLFYLSRTCPNGGRSSPVWTEKEAHREKSFQRKERHSVWFSLLTGGSKGGRKGKSKGKGKKGSKGENKAA